MNYRNLFQEFNDYEFESNTKYRPKDLTNPKDIFAFMKELWEMFPCEKRKDIDDDYWNKEVLRRLKEYKLLNYEYEQSCVRQDNN